MARITVEDCIDKFPSRFELVLVAANRARKLHSGEEPTVEKDNDKNTVIALREIADETISSEDLKNSLIEEHQTVSLSDEEDDNNLEKISDEEEENNNESDSKDVDIIQSEENEQALLNQTSESDENISNTNEETNENNNSFENDSGSNNPDEKVE